MHHKNDTWTVSREFYLQSNFFFHSLSTAHYISIIKFRANQSLCHVDKSIFGVHGINDLIMRSLMMVRVVEW